MMKRNLLLVVLSLFALLTMAQGKGKNYVEVLYFHGKQRCATCIAIEKYAREVVKKDFADERKKGRVVFRVVDISTSEGEKIAKIIVSLGLRFISMVGKKAKKLVMT